MSNTTLTTSEYDAVSSYLFGCPSSHDLRDWIGAPRHLDNGRTGAWTPRGLAVAISGILNKHGECAGQASAVERAFKKACRVLYGGQH